MTAAAGIGVRMELMDQSDAVGWKNC